MSDTATLQASDVRNRIPTGLPGGIFVYEADGALSVRFADPNVVALYGCEDFDDFLDFVGGGFSGMVHPDDYAKIQNDINAQTFGMEKKHDYVRYRICTKQGETRYVEDFGHLLSGEDGTRYFYVYIVDVNQGEFYNRNRNSLAESQVLASMADTDRLTGLMSMRALLDGAQALIDEGRDEDELCFAHFNILSFKVYNEEYGFQEGDNLLCHLGYVLAEEFAGALVARFSNDHFAVCARMGLPEMVEHVNHVHSAMLSANETTRVDVKAGIYELDPSCHEAGAACDHARLASNTVKRRYDRVYGIYDVKLYESLRLQQHVIDHVDEAAAQGQLKVFYQPIVRIATGEICGYEALARWDDPSLGFLPPSSFIGTLEDYCMIDKVDRFVIRKVCEDLRGLREAGEPVVPVSVNISRLDFELCDIFAFTEACRAEFDIEARLIDIEITESTLNENSLYLVDAIGQFRKAGHRVWVDDFGSGYSALNSLLDYDFEVLKLDLEFLRTYDEHPRAGVLMQNVMKMARGMGVEPLQEGVERQEHLEFLRSAGCEMAQGYLFGRPMPLDEARAHAREEGMSWEAQP